MGAQIDKSDTLQLEQHAPPLDQYQLKHSGSNYYVWEHCIQEDAMIEFPVYIPNNIIMKEEVDMYLLRHRHPLLVSSLYFRKNANTDKASIFYERVYTNLSRIKDIAFQDSLQFYYVALRGFQLLYKRFGYFEVEQSMFHLTRSNKVKVWCNKNIQKSKPNQAEYEIKGTMEDMVKKILRIIQENSDNAGNHFPIGAIIYEEASQSFASAIQKFREICRHQKLAIPQKLTCLQAVCKGNYSAMLDEYGKVNQQQNFIQTQDSWGEEIRATNSNGFSQTNESLPPRPASPHMLRTTEPKIERTASRLEGTNVRSSRKAKGLQISHSLQKLHSNHQQNHSVSFIQQNTTNFRNSRQVQPLVMLHKQTILNHPVNYQFQRPPFPQQRPPVSFVPNSPQHYYPPQSQQQPFRNVFMNNVPQVAQRPASPNVPPMLKRSSSVDNMNRTSSSLGSSQEYKVKISYAQTPNAKSHVILQTIPQAQFTHFLNVLPPQSPSRSVPQKVYTPQIVHTEPNINDFNRRPPSTFTISPQLPFNQNTFENRNTTNAIQNTRPQSRSRHPPRQTIIGQLINTKETQKYESLKDYTSLKARFEDYKRNFNFNQRDSTDNSSKFKQQLLGKLEYQYCGKQNLNNDFIKKEKPFFKDILKKDQTAFSYYGTNDFKMEQKLEVKNNKSEQVHGFPTVTDISDNVSYFPSEKRQGEGDNWREESVVVRHDPNDSKIKLPESRKYEPQIDSEIWEDMLKVQRKLKQASIEVRL